MKISEINENNIEIVMDVNQWDGWAAKVAKQRPDLINKILAYCRPVEKPSVWDVIPIEQINSVIVEYPDAEHHLVTKFPEKTVGILKVLEEHYKNSHEIISKLRVHYENIIPKLSTDVILEIVKAFPERAGWILKLKPEITDKVETIFKLED